jgi:hypothetical protein
MFVIYLFIYLFTHYLLQIEQRACTVHGSLKDLEDKRRTRATTREEVQKKRRDKQMNGLLLLLLLNVFNILFIFRTT